MPAKLTTRESFDTLMDYIFVQTEKAQLMDKLRPIAARQCQYCLACFDTSRGRAAHQRQCLQNPYGRRSSWNTKKMKYNSKIFRSSWEVIFAMYCDVADIAWRYESVRVKTWKNWVSDFLVDGELYEVGYHDHAESCEAFEENGWEGKWNWVEARDLDTMWEFLPITYKELWKDLWEKAS